MHNILDIIDNIDTIYNSDGSLATLKDFERVLDELDLYVFDHWQDGEIVSGPVVSRHWVECSFMWPIKNKPDREGAKRLHEYGCRIIYRKDVLLKPRKVKSEADFRTNSRKGVIDEIPVWVIEIKMPKRLISEIFYGDYHKMMDDVKQSKGKPKVDTALNPTEMDAVNQPQQPGMGGQSMGGQFGMGGQPPMGGGL